MLLGIPYRDRQEPRGGAPRTPAPRPSRPAPGGGRLGDPGGGSPVPSKERSIEQPALARRRRPDQCLLAPRQLDAVDRGLPSDARGPLLQLRAVADDVVVARPRRPVSVHPRRSQDLRHHSHRRAPHRSGGPGASPAAGVSGPDLVVLRASPLARPFPFAFSLLVALCFAFLAGSFERRSSVTVLLVAPWSPHCWSPPPRPDRPAAWHHDSIALAGARRACCGHVAWPRRLPVVTLLRSTSRSRALARALAAALPDPDRPDARPP